jgi:phosphatidylinositol alpha-mannosyltransferase
MTVGLVCPYSWDGPGGVQEHIRDLAEALMDLVHEVSVISPAGDDELLPDHVVLAGRAVPVPCNGAGRSPRGCPAGLGAKWRSLKA